MDPRSTAPRLLGSPRGSVDELAQRGRVDIPHLLEARAHTAAEGARLDECFRGDDIAPELSIVVFGSWAREELTDESDDDFAVVVAREFEAYDDDVCRAMLVARRELGEGAKQPGSQDVFGVPFEFEAVVRHIGLDADSNTNLTRRMLLLLESRELAGVVRGACWDQVLDRYLASGAKDHRPPRFLLNDLVRYWRTICVDFEGKHLDRQGGDPKWATRNAKLRTSRKLLFAGGLLPVLLCHELTHSQMRPFLAAWFDAPPLERLAAAFLHLDAVDEGARALHAYDRWIAIQQSAEARNVLRNVREETRDGSAVFGEVREIGKRFESALLALLYDTPLSQIARRYAIF